MDFLQSFVANAPWDKDDLIRSWSQKVKGQAPIMVRYAKNTIFAQGEACSNRLVANFL